MVWTTDPDSEMAVLIEVLAIGLVLGTCFLALFVEFRVYRLRHHDVKRGEKEFDSEETDDNPLYDDSRANTLIAVTLSEPGPVDLQFKQVESSNAEGAFAIKVVNVGKNVQTQHPELPGLFLREVAGTSVEGLELEAVLPLVAEVNERVELTLVFSNNDSSSAAAGDVMNAVDTHQRLGQMQSSLSLTSLVGANL